MPQAVRAGKTEHAKRAPAKKKRARCRFEDAMAEHSGDGTDGGDDEDSSEEETAEDKAFIDNGPVKGRRERLPRLTAEEKEVSNDELENLRDTCLELCSGGSKKRVRKSKQAYADPDDLDAATLSDEDFVASSSGEEDLREAELKVGRAIGSYLQSQGVKNTSGAAEKAPAAGKKPYSSLSA